MPFARRRLEHGGALSQGKRKTIRPIDPRKSIHLVLRSSRARGEWSFFRPAQQKRVKAIVTEQAKRFCVRVYQYANSGNHLHLLIKAPTRKSFQGFLKTISGLIARAVTGAKKGNSQGKFWDALAYTRVVEWGKAFFAAQFYVLQNEMEAAGVWSRKLLKPKFKGT